MTTPINKDPVISTGLSKTPSDSKGYKAGVGGESRPNVEEARYMPPQERLTQVMKEMKSMVEHRPDRASIISAMKDRITERQPEAMQIIREGKMVTLPTKDKEGKPVEEAAAAHKLKEALELLNKMTPSKANEKGEELSPFEKAFLVHFTEGKGLGEFLAEGKFKFLAKSAKAWGEFFEKFMPFTTTKNAQVSQIEKLIFRGLIESTLISDIQFLTGMVDKFARLQLQGNELLAKLATLPPGEVLEGSVLAEWLGKNDFSYEGLSHKIVNPEGAAGNLLAEAYQSPAEMREALLAEGMRDATRGIALSARTEQLMAEKLKLPPLYFRRGKKEKGLFGSLFEGSGEAGPVFVPWYRHFLKPQTFKGKPKWWIPLLYFVGFSTAVFFVFYVVRFLLQR